MFDPKTNPYYWARASRILRGEEFELPLSRVEKIPTIDEWLEGPEGKSAVRLLNAADHEILLGYSETVMSKTNAVVFTSAGFVSHSGVVGMAAVYSQEEPQRHPLEPAEAVRRAIDYEFDEIQSENDVVTFLREKLNDYAEQVFQDQRDKLAAEAASQAARASGTFATCRKTS